MATATKPPLDPNAPGYDEGAANMWKWQNQDPGFSNPGTPDPSVLQAQQDQYGGSTTSPTSEGAYQPGGAFYTPPAGAQGPTQAPSDPYSTSNAPWVPPTQQQIQQGLYDTAATGINQAADRQRQSLLEGTFGTGVGNSSMQVELQGRLAQEHDNALAQAAMEALTGAGAETRAGQQLQLQQQALAQQGNQFGQSLGFNYAQLGQQATQADLARQSAMQLLQTQIGGQSGLSAQQAAQALAAQINSQQFTGGQNTQAQQAALQQLMASIGGQSGLSAQNAAQNLVAQQGAQTFTGQQNTQAQAAALQQLMAQIGGQAGLQQSAQTFTGQQNTQAQQAALSQLMANIQGQQGLSAQQAAQNLVAQMTGQTFTGSQNTQAQAAAQALMNMQIQAAQAAQTAGQGFQTTQQQALFDQQMQLLSQQFHNQQALIGQQQLGTGISAGLGGLLALLAPYFNLPKTNTGTT